MTDALDWSRVRANHRGGAHHHAEELCAGYQLVASRCTEAVQALCFLAGANSIFYGEKLLTTGNPEADRDRALFAKLDIKPL